MPGTKRPAHPTQNTQGFRRKIRRPNALHKRFIAGSKYNDLDQTFQVITANSSITTDGNGEAFGKLAAYQVQYAPAWGVYSNLFERFKILWLQVKFHPDGAFRTIYSATEFDEQTTPTDLNSDIMRLSSLRTHDLNQDKHCTQRTMKLTGGEKFKDYEKCNEVGSKFGTTENEARDVKAMIAFYASAPPNTKMDLTARFGVAFKHMVSSATVT